MTQEAIDWISVADSVPEIVTGCCTSRTVLAFDGECVFAAYRYGSGDSIRWTTGDDDEDFFTVTHWAEMPKGPVT
jgi:hypothetical protein